MIRTEQPCTQITRRIFIIAVKNRENSTSRETETIRKNLYRPVCVCVCIAIAERSTLELDRTLLRIKTGKYRVCKIIRNIP